MKKTRFNNTTFKKILSTFLSFFFIITSLILSKSITSQASYVDTNLNTFVHDSDPTPEGVVGQDMQLAGNLALGATFRRIFSLVYVSAHGAYPFAHCSAPFISFV